MAERKPQSRPGEPMYGITRHNYGKGPACWIVRLRFSDRNSPSLYCKIDDRKHGNDPEKSLKVAKSVRDENLNIMGPEPGRRRKHPVPRLYRRSEQKRWEAYYTNPDTGRLNCISFRDEDYDYNSWDSFMDALNLRIHDQIRLYGKTSIVAKDAQELFKKYISNKGF